MKLLLVGIDFFGDRGSSDKNFWHQLLPIIAKDLEEIVVVSFNYRICHTESMQPNITIFNRRPFHLGWHFSRKGDGLGNPEKCHSHFSIQPRSFLERTFSVFYMLSFLKRLMNEKRISICHFMDNFGPAMVLPKRYIPRSRFLGSAMGYYAKGNFHDKYLQLSFKELDAVVPYAKEYEKKLEELGIESGKLRTIHWGTKNLSSTDTSKRRKMKGALGFNSDKVLLLWAGYIQQIQERSLLYAIEVAKKVLQESNVVQFIFALKTESYREEYHKFRSDDVWVGPTTQVEFRQLLEASDIFLSPVAKARSIVTPPLTWLECMSHSIPVFTTKSGGVSAVVESGCNGVVASSPDALANAVISSITNRSYIQMGEEAKRHKDKHYCIDTVAKEYIQFWRQQQQKILHPQAIDDSSYVTKQEGS